MGTGKRRGLQLAAERVKLGCHPEKDAASTGAIRGVCLGCGVTKTKEPKFRISVQLAKLGGKKWSKKAGKN